MSLRRSSADELWWHSRCTSTGLPERKNHDPPEHWYPESSFRRRAAEDGRLLARLLLPRQRNDLPARQPSLARAAQGGAHQEAPPRALGREPGPELHLGPSQPADQQ